MYSRSRNYRFTVKNERFEFRRTHPVQTVQRKHRLIDRHAGEQDDEGIIVYIGSPDPVVPPLLRNPKTFFSAKTIDQLIAEQGVSPVSDISIFAGVIPDDDIDEFVADIYRHRLG